jgi:peptidoglycan/xylan/chitin deacetylase (PgdA/CDA1 family)
VVNKAGGNIMKPLFKGKGQILLLIIIINVVTFCLFYNLGVYHRMKNNYIKKIEIKKLNKEAESRKNIQLVNSGDETNAIINNKDQRKIAYLTFDDGPSPNNTPKILDILKINNIKATFFIIGKNAEMNPELLKREVKEGHELAIHSYCHIINIIYKSPDAYVNDIKRCFDIIVSIVGKNSFNGKLIRFPDGSFSVSKQFRNAIAKAGYIYVDWNALVGDAEKPTMMPDDYLFDRLKTTTHNKSHVIILLHDAASKKTTTEILPEVISYLKEKGYTFDLIPE